jgi:pimeloyl-ACP methyl ester carboxylesterase
VMVHGGSQTGTNFTGTPDGREGWAQYFVRRGYAVYIVDQVGRGRSAYWAPQPYGALQGARLNFVEDRFVAPERSNMWPQAKLHNQFPGTARPGDVYFDQFYASQFPSIIDFTKQQEINRNGLVALLDKIGPAVLLTHSQSGAMGWPVADSRPNLVKAIIAIEPSGPPAHDLEMVGAPNWFRDATNVRISGISDIPITYDPPLTGGQKLDFVQQDKADKPDLARCWAQKEPARKLANLGRIPVVVVTSEASYHAPYDHCTFGYLKQAGVPVSQIYLAERGIRGNGHMMMIEKNNLAIARVLADWADRNVSGRDRDREARDRDDRRDREARDDRAERRDREDRGDRRDRERQERRERRDRHHDRD